MRLRPFADCTNVLPVSVIAVSHRFSSLTSQCEISLLLLLGFHIQWFWPLFVCISIVVII